MNFKHYDTSRFAALMPDYAGFATRMGFHGSPEIRALIASFASPLASKYGSAPPALPPPVVGIVWPRKSQLSPTSILNTKDN